MLLSYIAGFNIPCSFLGYGLIGVLPFLLSATFPNAAYFNKQWLPNAWLQWIWFFGMVFLSVVSFLIWTDVLSILGCKNHYSFQPYMRIVTPTKVILFGFISVLFGPIAEEVFFRGYLLEQLRKITHSNHALIIQSALFAITHLYYRGINHSIGVFLFGLIVGSWRIRFRSLLPIILTHIILNALFGFSFLKDLYNSAILISEFNIKIDWEDKIASKPKCQKLILLQEEPKEEAIPAIIGFFADSDEDVRIVAQYLIISQFRRYAEPYIKEALASKDKHIIVGALFVVEECHYSNLNKEVREAIWDNDDAHIQLSALITLKDIEDKDGLKDIAQKHANEKVRKWAKDILDRLEANDKKDDITQ